jgi:hypothetical protein
MTFIETISGFMFAIGEAIFEGLRAVLVWLLILVVIIIVFNIVARIVMRRKRNKFVTHEQGMILNAGKRAVKEKRLRDLFISDSGKKPVNMGKIIGFTRIEDTIRDKDEVRKQEKHVFIVKNRFRELAFFKVTPDRHTDAIGDVTLLDWNFTLDPETRFLVPNFREAVIIESRRMRFIKESGIDSIGSLKPIIHKAVQINPLHRIMIRLKSLIDLGDERSDYQEARP